MYRGRCIGRLQDFLNFYAGVTVAYECTFMGDGKTINLWGKRWCTYEWYKDTDKPVFTFTNERASELYIKQLVNFPYIGEDFYSHNLDWLTQEYAIHGWDDYTLNLMCNVHSHDINSEQMKTLPEHLRKCARAYAMTYAARWMFINGSYANRHKLAEECVQQHWKILDKHDVTSLIRIFDKYVPIKPDELVEEWAMLSMPNYTQECLSNVVGAEYALRD